MVRAALALYLINGGVSVLLGGLYLFHPSFMPYHAAAIGQEWAALPAPMQTLLDALMDVAGAGWLTLGVAVIGLTLFGVGRGDRWARALVPALLLLFYVPTLGATLSVLANTPAAPPWYGNAAACAATLAAVLLDRPWRRRGRRGD